MKPKTKYKERIKKRKNFAPLLFLVLTFWSVWGIIFYFVPPTGILILSLFLLTTFFAVFTTTSLILGNSRRGLIISLGITTSMLLNYFKIGNLLNLILLAGIIISVELYLSS